MTTYTINGANYHSDTQAYPGNTDSQWFLSANDDKGNNVQIEFNFGADAYDDQGNIIDADCLDWDNSKYIINVV